MLFCNSNLQNTALLSAFLEILTAVYRILLDKFVKMIYNIKYRI